MKENGNRMLWLLEKFRKRSGTAAFVYRERKYSYSWLLRKVYEYECKLTDTLGNYVFSIHGDYNPYVIAMFIALARRKKIVVPIATDAGEEVKNKLSTAQVEVSIRLTNNEPTFEAVSGEKPRNPLFGKILERNHAGLILFSSGSTGKPKAMIHDLDNLLETYRNKRTRNLKILAFLMFDHIGGLNTLLNTLSMGATIMIPENRNPDSICNLISKHKISLLPTSPTFLNLLLMSGTYRKYDLSSLKMITYGTEPMPESLLKKVRNTFPRVRFLQTFGTSETGIVTTSSKSSGSLYMKLNDPNIQWKVVGGELWLKGKTQVLGYLNYENPFTENGWFSTGDLVEVTNDGYIKILGRKDEIINVGGQKVLPMEVESVLLEMEEIKDAAIYGEANPILGQIPVAKVVLRGDAGEPKSGIVKRIKKYCAEKLQRYKVPIKIYVVDSLDCGTRFKKKRLTCFK